jgi:hypothetical protein
MRTAYLLLLFFCNAASTFAIDPPELDFFERRIRPKLVEHCYKCHSLDAETKGGLRLDSREFARQGGDSGAAVVPGNIEKSLLIAAVKYESLEMPPGRKLDDQTIADFVKWIEMGAPDPRETEKASLAMSATSAKSAKKPMDWQEALRFWSFQLPRRYPFPATAQPDWVCQPIDSFLLSKMESEGLHPNEPADRRILLRRLSLDLTGLSPSAEECKAFAQDQNPDAYERAVERLLIAPSFGERWARLWLDIARFAEDQAHIVGDNKELFYPNAHLYRDWIIQAFNSDMPYDQFLKLQLAADLMNPAHASDDVALGFIGLGPKYYRRNAPDVMAEEWEDRVDTVTRGMLGLTVACARCHDHKYDPIPTQDYYALAGVFAGVEMYNKPLTASAETKENGQAKKPDESIHIVRDTMPRDLKVMIRGDVANEGELVPRGFVRALERGEKICFTSGSGRMELADAIATKNNPLTARVIVNRIWGEIFGQPLVRTPSNFGKLGDPPSHPELLDDLSVRFMEQGWSLKWLVREMVLSSTYQQSSRRDARKAEIDPSNQWLWRANRRRLSVEAWRDTLLQASGSLNQNIGGKSIVPSDPVESRRTIYSAVSRFQLDSMLSLLDFPDPNTHSERRSSTTTPIQKLFSLNSPFMDERAKELANRILAQPDRTLSYRVKLAYEFALARQPEADELGLAIAFLEAGNESDDQWRRFAQVILVSNELLVVD